MIVCLSPLKLKLTKFYFSLVYFDIMRNDVVSNLGVGGHDGEYE